MKNVPVVEVQAPGGGTMVINESDFDPEVHTKVGAEEPSPESSDEDEATTRSRSRKKPPPSE